MLLDVEVNRIAGFVEIPSDKILGKGEKGGHVNVQASVGALRERNKEGRMKKG